MSYYVYIMTNKPRGTLYIGVTNNVLKRSYQHKQAETESFTKRYNLNKLVYIECYEYIEEAIQREKQLKNWQRQWKIELIEFVNPEWTDFAETIV